jgi:hypothetical protein
MNNAKSPLRKATDDGTCQDCGDAVPTRRIRCRHCGLLVCGWCYNHVHGMK